MRTTIVELKPLIQSATTAAILLGLTIQQAAATSILQTVVQANVISAGGTVVVSQQDTSPPDGSVSVTASGTGFNGAPYDGAAQAYVNASNYGELLLSGSSTFTGSSLQAGARSFISIQDSITLLSNGIGIGAPGVIDASAFLAGLLDVNENGVGGEGHDTTSVVIQAGSSTGLTTLLNIQLNWADGDGIPNQGFPPFHFEQCQINGTTISNGSDCLDRLYQFEIPFTFGTPFDLVVSVNATAVSSGSGFGSITSTASSDYDFAHSLYWGGFSSVTSGGVQVSDYGFHSDSGFDWRQSFIPTTNGVPEPGSMALIGVGLAALAWRRRSPPSGDE